MNAVRETAIPAPVMRVELRATGMISSEAATTRRGQGKLEKIPVGI
jgi:hypothetical protein